MANILITGVSGFVGGNLSEYLSSDVITGVSRKSRVNVITYKEVSRERMSEFSCVVHLAGKAHDLKKTSDDQEYFEANTELTKKLFDTFLKSSSRVFIYMSSVKAAADKVNGVLDENEIPNPITVYGKSKLAAEQYILSKKIPENKRAYILRPCMIHGPNNKGNLNLLYSFVSKGVPYPFGKFHNKRSYVSVENLCFVIKNMIINKNIESGIYNIADDGELSTNKLVRIIGNTIDKPAKVLNIPKFLVLTLAKLGDVLSLPVNSERLQKLTENYVVSNNKIKQAIGVDFPLTLEKGIEKTIQSFL
ncbi:NAD-dependent epimerase/dehydratase family protein [Wenyingzhuangia sp. IMCC45533]